MNPNPEAWTKAISTLGGQLVDALKPVAEKLGVAAEHMYGVMVKQSYVDGISSIVGWSMFASFIFYAGYRLRKDLNKELAAEKISENDYFGMFVFSWFVQGLAVIMISMTLCFNLPSILNPEYAAIKTLIDAVPHGK